MFNQDWTYKKLIKYVSPSIFSVIFISLYTIIDGLFISRYVGTEALAALNVVYPLYNIIFSITIMFCVGGSVIVAINLGEKKYQEANNSFSLITLSNLLISVISSVIGLLFIYPILDILGVTPNLMHHGKIYAQILLISAPFVALKFSIEYFLRVDNNARLSFIITLIGGITNIVLDYVFVVIFKWGVAGAGLATFAGIFISALIGLFYFVKYRKHLKYIIPVFHFQTIISTFINGVSEMITELSFGVVTFLFNSFLMKYAGYKGVAAYTALLYIFYVFRSVFFGVTTGVQPVISYNIGSRSFHIIREIIFKSTTLIAIYSLLAFMLMQFKGEFLTRIFVVNDNETVELAIVGMKYFSYGLLIGGLNIFGIGYFNAIDKGKTAVSISFSKFIFFTIPGLFILSKLYGLNGIWLSLPVSELCTFTMLIAVSLKNKIKTKRFATLEAINK